MVDSSESSLFTIHHELEHSFSSSCQLIPILGSINDSAMISSLMNIHRVQVVFHAAAYKHVPMVESNPLVAIQNNTLGTATIAKAAIRTGVDKFILISTDKAVRPANVMGATKRVAELILQVLSEQNSPTTFSIVRFGNVLGSSGSVVPLFRKQIALGGPITLTHPDVIRYFMTITEAVQLVIQSAVLSEGGDLFLLDMGDPVSIKSLAYQMVGLSGLTVCDESYPEGDIKIKYIGLRPGEKLFEELLIDAESIPTKHPLIFRAHESTIPAELLWSLLQSVEHAINVQDTDSALSCLSQLVPEWQNSRNSR